jgi:hypothetical protein
MQNGGNVGSHEIFAIAQTDHDRGAVARGNDLVGIAARQSGQREHSGELLDGRADGLFQVSGEVFLDEMGDDFGIGFRFENVAFGFELVFQGQVILDDAVMDDDDVAFAIAVRMRVLLGRPAMRGPAGMADTVAAIDRILADGLFQIAQFAGGATDAQVSSSQ